MAFEELRVFPRGEKDDKETVDAMLLRLAVKLAEALMDNPNMNAEDGANVLLDGLVKTRIGSSVKPPAQLMAPDVRAALGDKIVWWGIEHGDWGTGDEEDAATVVELDAFVNGSLAALVGPSVGGERREVEAEGGEEKEGKEGGGGDSSIQNLTCGDEGGKLLADKREWIKEMMVVETLKEFAKCVGRNLDECKLMDGVEFDEKGHITKIEWSKKGLNGNLNKFKDWAKRMPRLQVLDLRDNRDLKGT
jgi:hypothetical protein